MVFFLTAAISAPVPASTEVEAMYYELEKVSATVTSHETLFLLLYGVIDAPSGRFRDEPIPSRRMHCTLMKVSLQGIHVLAANTSVLKYFKYPGTTFHGA